MYADVGFEIHVGAVELRLEEVPVVACHFPVAGDSQIQDRFSDHRPEVSADAWLLRGHAHEKWKINKRQINVGVDVWDFRPVSEETLLDLIRSEQLR